MMLGQTTTPTTTHSLSTAELAAVSGLAGFSLLLVLAFIAYVVFGKDAQFLKEAGLWTIAGQITLSIFVIFSVTLLMLKEVVKPEAGLPILAGITGVIIGKARGGGNGVPPTPKDDDTKNRGITGGEGTASTPGASPSQRAALD